MKTRKTNLLPALLAGAAIGVISTAAMADGELHIYNWTDYTSPELVKKFEAETGIKVTIDTYDSNESALAKLSSGAAGYDVMVIDRKSTRLNSSHIQKSRMPSSA